MASSTTTLDLDGIRAQLPVLERVAYLNTGTAGPLPTVTARAVAEAGEQELAEGRIGIAAFHEFFDRLSALRAALAGLVGAGEQEIALTHNTTEGMNVGTWGLEWEPGDEVVTTTLEHGGALLPLYQLHRRRGVKVTFADVRGGGSEDALTALERAIRPGVRLVVLSHVTWSTGAVLPLREITGMAHAAGALVLVDGAQSAGAIDVDVHDLGVDFYALPGHKWLCGPEGTGALYVRRDLLEVLQPTHVGFFGADHDGYRPNDVTGMALVDSAQRYEVGSVYRPSLVGLLASVRWVAAQQGRVAAIRGLAEHCLRRVRALPGVELLTPPDTTPSGLVAFRLPGLDLPGCVEHLAGERVAVRSIPDTGSLRISCGFYNTPEEIDRAIALIDAYRR